MVGASGVISLYKHTSKLSHETNKVLENLNEVFL